MKILSEIGPTVGGQGGRDMWNGSRKVAESSDRSRPQNEYTANARLYQAERGLNKSASWKAGPSLQLYNTGRTGIYFSRWL